MREIKFRAWEEASKRMLDWNYFRNIGMDLLFYKGKNPLVIMQYTGLKDKNGKEIYENDVIDFENGYISEIFYQDGAFKLNDNIYRSDLSHGIIIGNIYQNPELIK